MEFLIDKNSSTPIIKQIQDQIKLSIAMGVLKRGDILPSIREVERQTGINRGQIHLAYLALQQSGLLSPTPSKRTAVAISAAAPDSVKKCQELTEDIIQRLMRISVSPIAYARYLSRSVQEYERKSPFIAYVDWDKETALRRAEQVSKLWQASVVGLSVDEYKLVLSHRSKLRKVLVNHLAHDSIQHIPSRRKIDIIPIEICYTAQIIRAFRRIKDNSSILIVLPNHAVSVARFIVDRLHKLIEHKDVGISWIAVTEMADFARLLNNSQYDRILVSPGARNTVPIGQRRVSRILQLEMEFDPEGLEIARIRSGVIA